MRAKGEVERAKADFSYAIKLDRAHMGAYHNRGLVEVANGELDPAVADFTAALRLDWDFVDGYEARAEAFLAKTDARAPSPTSTRQFAATPIARATITARHRFSINHYMGFSAAQLDKEDIERAIADFADAIRLDDKSAAAHYARGLAESTNGHRDRAALDFAEAVRLRA